MMFKNLIRNNIAAIVVFGITIAISIAIGTGDLTHSVLAGRGK
jgi:hypothetical protein